MIDRSSFDPRRQTDRRVADRRQEPRHFSPASIRFLRAETGPEEVLQGKLLNVSVTGARLVLEDPLKPSEKLLIELRDTRGHCFNLTAEVVWIESANDGLYDVGCELCVELSARQLRLMQQMASADHPPR